MIYRARNQSKRHSPEEYCSGRSLRIRLHVSNRGEVGLLQRAGSSLALIESDVSLS